MSILGKQLTRPYSNKNLILASLHCKILAWLELKFSFPEMVEFPRRSEFIPAAKVRQVNDLAVEKRAREGLKSKIKENIKIVYTPKCKTI